MLRITTHIERLLLIHDCVIIPEVGGFVLQTVSSGYIKEDHLFSPMHKEIVFNKALHHNDGLLPESYMQTYSISYKKAQKLVKEDIAELKSTLEKYGKVSFGKTGSLSIGNEGQWIFHPGKTEFFNIDFYGLSPFQFPVLPVEEKAEVVPLEQKKRKKDIFYLPINMRVIRGAVASVAAVAFFFLVSTPVEDVKQSAYTASIIPAEILLPKTTSSGPAITEISVTEENKAETVPAPTVVEAQPVEVSKKMFHIIVGSFPSEETASDFLSRINRNEYVNAGIVARDDRFRVYANKFDNRQEAEKYLSEIRETDKYKDAWLFIGR